MHRDPNRDLPPTKESLVLFGRFRDCFLSYAYTPVGLFSPPAGPRSTTLLPSLRLHDCISTFLPAKQVYFWYSRWFSTQALLLRDLALLATVYFVGYRLAGIRSLLDILSAVPQAPAAAASSSPLVTVFFFGLLLALCGALAVVAGTLWFALFVHANEAASGLFTPSTAVNHAVAMCLNTAMLIPYKPKRAGCPYEAPAIR